MLVVTDLKDKFLILVEVTDAGRKMISRCFFPLFCRYHSLLKSLKSLIGKTKSSHLKTLLDKHCPVLFLQEDALKSANTTSQVYIFSYDNVFNKISVNFE